MVSAVEKIKQDERLSSDGADPVQRVVGASISEGVTFKQLKETGMSEGICTKCKVFKRGKACDVGVWWGWPRSGHHGSS